MGKMPVEKIRTIPLYKTKLFELFQTFSNAYKRDPSGSDLSNMDSEVIAYIRENGLDVTKSSNYRIEMNRADSNNSL
jgi:hypothetical protein